jgi:predicted transcriptional regulator
MSVNDRLQLVMNHFDLSVNSLAVQLGISRTAIHNIVSENGRRTSPSHDFYTKLKESYENINLNWLITGEGKMLLDSAPLLAAEAQGEYKKSPDLKQALLSIQEELSEVKKRIERLEKG